MKDLVTPFVGVWIETKLLQLLGYGRLSHPSWVCGLKLRFGVERHEVPHVTPFVGVWIETSMRH